jgi:hypothetical protein
MPKNSHGIDLRVNRRELATILAALRFHQDENLQGGRDIADQCIKDIATDGGLVKPLGFRDVGKLCERLNAPQGATSPTGLAIEPPPEEHDDGGALFRVVYVIDVQAASPLQAARRAHNLMVSPESMAPVLEVLDHRGSTVAIDLSEESAS